MKVNVKCFSTLADAEACDYKDTTEYELQAGATPVQLMEKLNISPDQVKLIFVNGKRATPETQLSEGDQVGLAPAVGGM